jgi:hypothetical protein
MTLKGLLAIAVLIISLLVIAIIVFLFRQHALRTELLNASEEFIAALVVTQTVPEGVMVLNCDFALPRNIKTISGCIMDDSDNHFYVCININISHTYYLEIIRQSGTNKIDPSFQRTLRMRSIEYLYNKSCGCN